MRIIFIFLMAINFASAQPCSPPCFDNNPCTVDSCRSGNCFYPQRCVSIDACNPGSCIVRNGIFLRCSTNPRTCNDNDVCTKDICQLKSTFPFFTCLNTIYDCCCITSRMSYQQKLQYIETQHDSLQAIFDANQIIQMNQKKRFKREYFNQCRP